MSFNKKQTLFCSKHKSEIGGVCDNMDCESINQLQCVKCVTENSSCIRAMKHNLISIDEFIDNVFNRHIAALKSNYSYTQSLNSLESYLNNGDKYLKDFKERFNEIEKQINFRFNSLKDIITETQDKLVQQFKQRLSSEEKNFEDGISRLRNLMSYELIGHFDINKCKEYLRNMPFESYNDAMKNIKTSFLHMKKKTFVQEEEKLSNLLSISPNRIDTLLHKTDEVRDRFLSLSNQISSSVDLMFNGQLDEDKVNTEDEKPIDCLYPFKECLIDYSDNSNFIDKTFLAFQHSNKEFILAYPTSLNTIRLESLDTIFTEEEKKGELSLKKDVFNNDRIPQSKDNDYYSFLTFQPKASDRDKFLKLKLTGHGAKITKIIYHQIGKNTMNQQESIKEISSGNNTFNSNNMNKVLTSNKKDNSAKLNNSLLESVTDLLITASEDRTVKIWNITELTLLNQTQNSKLNLSNKLTYTSPLLKSIIGQFNVIDLQVFFNPLHDITTNLELVTLGYGDKLKVYDLKTANLKKELGKINESSYDTCFIIFNKEEANFLISANHENHVRVWDYEKSSVMFFVNYPDCKVISIIPIYGVDNLITDNFILVDDKGFNSTLNINAKLLAKLECKFHSSSSYSARSSAIMWRNKSILFGYKNGAIREYSFNSLKEESSIEPIQTKNVSVKGVTHMQKLVHSKEGVLLLVHYQNQRLIIYK